MTWKLSRMLQLKARIRLCLLHSELEGVKICNHFFDLRFEVVSFFPDFGVSTAGVVVSFTN